MEGLPASAGRGQERRDGDERSDHEENQRPAGCLARSSRPRRCPSGAASPRGRARRRYRDRYRRTSRRTCHRSGGSDSDAPGAPNWVAGRSGRLALGRSSRLARARLSLLRRRRRRRPRDRAGRLAVDPEDLHLVVLAGVEVAVPEQLVVAVRESVGALLGLAVLAVAGGVVGAAQDDRALRSRAPTSGSPRCRLCSGSAKKKCRWNVQTCGSLRVSDGRFAGSLVDLHGAVVAGRAVRRSRQCRLSGDPGEGQQAGHQNAASARPPGHEITTLVHDDAPSPGQSDGKLGSPSTFMQLLLASLARPRNRSASEGGRAIERV